MVFDFVRRYLLRRPWGLLPSALPAVLAALLAAGVGVWLVWEPDSDVVVRIEQQLQDAVRAEDLARQRVCLKALMRRSPDSAFYRFQYALLLRREGQQEAGQQLLEQLAAEGGTGYVRAHRELASEAMTRYGQVTDPDERQALRRAAIRHLEALGEDRGIEWDYRLGLLYGDEGEVPLAEVQLRRAAKAGYGAAQMMLSRLLLYQGDREAARELREQARVTLESYIADHPEDLEARITWARCLLDGSEWTRLTQVLTGLEALETDANFRDRLGQLAIAASQQQRLSSPLEIQLAVEYARFAFPLLVDRSAAAWRLVELAGFGIEVPVQVLQRVGEWLDETDENPPADPRKLASRWFLRALLAEVSGDPVAAEQAYQQAADLDANFLRELATYYRRQGKAEQLLETGRRIREHFEPVLEEHPENTAARISLAEVAADRGQWEEMRNLLAVPDGPVLLRIAMAELCTRRFDAQVAELSELQPGDASAENDAEGAAGDQAEPADESLPDYGLLRTALESVPDYQPAVSRLESAMYGGSPAGQDAVHRMLLEMSAAGEQPAAVHRLLGLRASDLQDWPTAVAHFEQAVRLRPDDGLLRNNLAYSLLKTEPSNAQLKRAALLATEALALAPGQPEILATLGEIRVALRDYRAAIEDLEQALTSLKSRPELHALLAECYEALGMKQLADAHRAKTQ
jgi:tetratricopeptide (TPR) repeat protein